MKRNIKDTHQYNEIMDMQKTRSRHVFDALLKAHNRRYGPGITLNSITYSGAILIVNFENCLYLVKELPLIIWHILIEYLADYTIELYHRFIFPKELWSTGKSSKTSYLGKMFYVHSSWNDNGSREDPNPYRAWMTLSVKPSESASFCTLRVTLSFLLFYFTLCP